nr:hypothetical protein [Acidobacteriota bacterium]
MRSCRLAAERGARRLLLAAAALSVAPLAGAQQAPEPPPVPSDVPPLVVERCPAAGSARLGEGAVLLERRAVEAVHDEDPG